MVCKETVEELLRILAYPKFRRDRTVSSLLIEWYSDSRCEAPEVVEVFAADAVYDCPVHLPIVVYCNIAESDGSAKVGGDPIFDDTHACQCCERLAHGRRRGFLGCGDEMARKFDTQLDAAGKVEHDDILQIGILCQQRSIVRTFLDNARNAMAQCLQLLAD